MHQRRCRVLTLIEEQNKSAKKKSVKKTMTEVSQWSNLPVCLRIHSQKHGELYELRAAKAERYWENDPWITKYCKLPAAKVERPRQPKLFEGHPYWESQIKLNDCHVPLGKPVYQRKQTRDRPEYRQREVRQPGPKPVAGEVPAHIPNRQQPNSIAWDAWHCEKSVSKG